MEARLVEERDRIKSEVRNEILMMLSEQTAEEVIKSGRTAKQMNRDAG